MIISLGITLVIQVPQFVDATTELGLSFSDSAACWADLNGDGWTDLIAGGVVWFNREGKSFERGSEVGTVVAADFDNDGDVDLFSWSQLTLFENKNRGEFIKRALPELPKTVSRGACWTDLNSDGFVDIYIGGYENWNDQVSYPDIVLMNRNGKSFELVWQNSSHRARGVSACDFDRNGRPEVYVSNYRLMPNDLWILNKLELMINGSASFGTIATSKGFGGGHSIGAAWGDFNNDGWIDLFAGNFAHVDNRGDQPKSRFLINKIADFDDIGTRGVFYQESYASPVTGDFDNDGNLDLFFTTVYETASFGKKNYPVLFMNDGKVNFTDQTESSGLEKLGATYQAACADFDRDGDLDIVTDGKLFINQLVESNWLEVKLNCSTDWVNGSVIGAQVRVYAGNKIMTRQIEAGTGEGNQNDLTLHFGLGEFSDSVKVEIFWPNGKLQMLEDVKQKQLLTVNYK